MSQRIDYNAVATAGMKALGAVYGYVRHSGLPARLVELVFLRVSQLNGCAYCIDLHSRELLASGFPVEHLVLVPAWREAAKLFGEEESAALAWAEEVTRLRGHRVSDASFAAASAVFGEKTLVDLTLAIALMNAYNRVAISFRAQPLAVSAVASSLAG
jgi:AhpD family alkylhydroperoxidase